MIQAIIHFIRQSSDDFVTRLAYFVRSTDGHVSLEKYVPVCFRSRMTPKK